MILKTIIKNNSDVVVIVDEAYIDFGGDSAISLIDKYENVLVTRTFSKSRSLAGLRLGYALGSKELISAMLDVKFSSIHIQSMHLHLSVQASLLKMSHTSEKLWQRLYIQEKTLQENLRAEVLRFFLLQLTSFLQSTEKSLLNSYLKNLRREIFM